MEWKKRRRWAAGLLAALILFAPGPEQGAPAHAETSAPAVESPKASAALTAEPPAHTEKAEAAVTPAPETPAPETTETPAPEVTETLAPEVTETPAPVATETPAPEVTETPAPEVTETPAPVATETPAPVATETPAPETTETPAPETTETPAPEVSPAIDPTVTPMPTMPGIQILERSEAWEDNHLDAGSLRLPEGGMRIPLIYQYDYKTAVCTLDGSSKSVASSGCGAAAASMLIAYIRQDYEQTPYTLFYDAAESGRYRGDGLSYGNVRHMLSTHGVESGMKDVGKSAIRDALKNDYPIVIKMGPGTFTDNGHYIILRGTDGDDRVWVNDPNSSGRSAESHSLKKIVEEAKSSEMLVVYSRPKGYEAERAPEAAETPAPVETPAPTATPRPPVVNRTPRPGEMSIAMDATLPPDMPVAMDAPR